MYKHKNTLLCYAWETMRWADPKKQQEYDVLEVIIIIEYNTQAKPNTRMKKKILKCIQLSVRSFLFWFIFSSAMTTWCCDGVVFIEQLFTEVRSRKKTRTFVARHNNNDDDGILFTFHFLSHEYCSAHAKRSNLFAAIMGTGNGSYMKCKKSINAFRKTFPGC